MRAAEIHAGPGPGSGAGPAPAAEDRRGDRRARVLAFAVLLVPYLALVRRFDFLNDDAFIAFRYARNLAAGHGLCFNPGTVPPAEGYSCPLWVLWLALLERLGLHAPLWSRVSSVACGLALSWVFLGVLRRRFRLATAELALAGAALATLPGFALWSTGGMETMLLALLVLGTWACLLGTEGRPRAGLAATLAALAALARTDGAGYVGLVALAALARAWRLSRPRHEGADGGRRTARAALGVLAAVALSLAAQTVFRLAYYDAWLPLPARLKTGLSAMRLERGLDYVLTNLLQAPALALCLPLLALALARRRALAGGAALVVAGTLGYALWVGGDFLPFGRFLVPALPFAVLGLVALVPRPAREPGTAAGAPAPRPAFLAGAAALVALSALSAFDRQLLPRKTLQRFAFRYSETRFETELENWRKVVYFAESWSLLGRALQRFTKPGESIVLYPIGAVGYYCDLRIYDMYGLTHREAARAAVPVRRASPGHDMKVPEDFYLPYEPTYLLASLAKRGVAFPNVEAVTPRSPYVDSLRVVRHPLPVEEGFPPDAELVLLEIVR